MRIALIVGFAVAAVLALFLLPAIPQDPAYHSFADQRTIWGTPIFWNVISNLPFLLVAIWGLRAVRAHSAFQQNWERTAYCLLLAGVAFVTFGSAYYHLSPNDTSLFWDRLPMTIAFMSLFATTIGERISMRAGRLLLSPLIALGAASVLYWRLSGDLRPYVLVQFLPMITLPLMAVLLRPRYTGTNGILGMIGFYTLAKILELFDRQIGEILATAGHPWKHIAAALAMLCYLNTVARRQRAGNIDEPYPIAAPALAAQQAGDGEVAETCSGNWANSCGAQQCTKFKFRFRPRFAIHAKSAPSLLYDYYKSRYERRRDTTGHT